MIEDPGEASQAGAVSPEPLHCLRVLVWPFCHGCKLGAAVPSTRCTLLQDLAFTVPAQSVALSQLPVHSRHPADAGVTELPGRPIPVLTWLQAPAQNLLVQV